jgi:hypothetical protein
MIQKYKYEPDSITYKRVMWAHRMLRVEAEERAEILWAAREMSVGGRRGGRRRGDGGFGFKTGGDEYASN